MTYLITSDRLQLIGELKASIPLILSSISTFIFSENLDVRLKVLKCLQSWIQYGISLE